MDGTDRLYYDKDSNEITFEEWAKLAPTPQEREDYRRVGSTTLADGTWISTVWLGMNHRYGDGPPLIFETMVFSSYDNLDERDMERYSTLAEAQAGHLTMVEKWSHND